MQVNRRELLLAISAAAAAGSGLDSNKRMQRALAGKEIDRPPVGAWRHFHLESEPPESFARATIAFHQQAGTDFVKVMSDFAYPTGGKKLADLKVEAEPYPAQLRALELIRDGVGADTFFIETIFNSWSVAEKLSSRESLLTLKKSDPQKLTDILDVITRSQVNHARQALATGARGIFLAIQNAVPEVLTEEEYAKFSEPFDKTILAAVHSAPFNILHLHGDRVYWQRFTRGWAPAGINYSAVGTQVPIAELRRQFGGLILSGIDERSFPQLTMEQIRQQAKTAWHEAGRYFVLTPGCSIPDSSAAGVVRQLRTAF